MARTPSGHGPPPREKQFLVTGYELTAHEAIMSDMVTQETEAAKIVNVEFHGYYAGTTDHDKIMICFEVNDCVDFTVQLSHVLSQVLGDG